MRPLRQLRSGSYVRRPGSLGVVGIMTPRTKHNWVPIGRYVCVQLGNINPTPRAYPLAHVGQSKSQDEPLADVVHPV